MNWLRGVLARLSAWHSRNFGPRAAIEALASMDVVGLERAGAFRYAAMAKYAKAKGWGITKRKRAGNVVIIIKVPRPDGSLVKLRFKFKEKV